LQLDERRIGLLQRSMAGQVLRHFQAHSITVARQMSGHSPYMAP
jgi:hypothetical protein